MIDEHHSGPLKATEGGRTHSDANPSEVSSEARTRSTLSEHLKDAWKLNSSYQPPGFGRPYRTPMWEFVRRAKTHPDLASLDAYAAAASVERCLAGWEGYGVDTWQTCFPESDDPKAEFVSTWDRIKWGQGALEQAVINADKLPLEPILSPSPKYETFISIVGHLQRLVEGPILVPCSTFAALLGCQGMTITRYRELAKASGLMRLVRKGIKAQKKADEFSFAVEQFDWESGKQIVSENLNLCLTSPARCYTEVQEKQEKERNKEPQERKEVEEIHEMQRETRAHFPEEGRRFSVRQEPYIPTTAELARNLEKTKHLRGT